jgi:hypothetical protein
MENSGSMGENKPPATLDGAKVLWWAWSGEAPFGFMEYTGGGIAAEIYGQAICQYEGSEEVYRFYCNRLWEVESDQVHESIDQAMFGLHLGYRNVPLHWVKYE